MSQKTITVVDNVGKLHQIPADTPMDKIKSLKESGEQDSQCLPRIDINDATALKELATQALVEIIQKSPRNVSLVAACRELLDRVVGKPMQTQIIETKGTIEHRVLLPATQQFLDSIIGPVIENQ